MFLALCNSLICPVQKPVDNLTVAVSVILKQSMMTSKENPTIRLFSFYSAGQVDTNFFRVIIIAVCWSVSWSLMCLCCFSLLLLWTHRLFKSCNRWKSWDSLGGGLENCSERQMFAETVLLLCYICLRGFIATLRISLLLMLWWKKGFECICS